MRARNRDIFKSPDHIRVVLLSIHDCRDLFASSPLTRPHLSLLLLVRRFLNSMDIRLPATTILALPHQHLGTQRTLAYRPALSLAIHRQQIPSIQRQISRRLPRLVELQVLPSFYRNTAVLLLYVGERGLGVGSERATPERKRREGTVAGTDWTE